MQIRVAVAAFALTLGLAVSPAHAAVTTEPVPPTTDQGTVGTNPFLPEDVNIGDCISSMPRPNCGTTNRSGYHQWLVFGVLLGGTVLIGWRIARAVRAGERRLDEQAGTGTA